MSGYSVGALEFGTTPNDTVIDQVESVNLDPAIAHMLAAGSSRIDPGFVANIQSNPTIQFSTTDIFQLYTTLGIDGLPIDFTPATGNPNECKVYFRKAEQGAGYDDTAAVKATIDLGYAHLVDVQASVTQPQVRATGAIIPITDRTKDAIVFAKGVAYGVGIKEHKHYGLGPVKINGDLLVGVQRVRFITGIVVRRERDANFVFPVFAGLGSRQPIIEIDLLDLDDVVKTTGKFEGTDGVPITSETTWFWRNILKGGTFDAHVSTTHLKHTVTDGMVYLLPITGQSQQAANYTVRIVPTRDEHEATPADVVVLETGKAIT